MAAGSGRSTPGAGVNNFLSPRDAWFLSGGVMGDQNDRDGVIPLAKVAQHVPDCLAFVDDYHNQW